MANELEKKVVVGVDKAYFALITTDDETGYVVGSPQLLSPTMELKSTPASASETLYADNGPNDNVAAEGETDIEITSPNFAESVVAQLKGATYDSATGRVFDNADPSQAPYFALGYRFKKSNGHYRYRWYLKCRVEPPGEEAQSQSNAVNFKPQTLKIKALKTIYQFDLLGDGSLMDGVKRVHGDEDADNFSATTWFDAVQVPVAGTPAAFTLTTSPVDGATGVVVTANVVLTFSNALAGGAEDSIVLVRSDTQAAIACTRTINSARKVVTLDPVSSLTAAKTYLVIIPGVTDIHGQTLADTVIDFATA
jgi:phi13 family phage major tail protein